MKKTTKILIFLLCLSVFLSIFVSCSSRGKTLMSLGEKTFSVNTYELMLSRMKGNLELYGSTTVPGYSDTDAFWRTVISSDNTTWNDYFCAAIMDESKIYLVSDYLFDEYGLEISKEKEKNVDDLMAAMVKRAGSKNNLNASLGEYGANYNVLRDLYILETKIDILKAHLYGEKGEKIDEATKESFLKENYTAFGQIFVAGYYEIIDKDNFGDYVYYTDGKHSEIAYDKVNGKTKIDEFGKTELDILGHPTYYIADGKIAYDKKNGVLGYALDDDGNKMIENYDSEKLSELKKNADKYASECNGDINLFKEYADAYGEGESDGDAVYLYFGEEYYYSLQNESFAYLDEITKALGEMKVGECRTVKSDFGYHVICKYETEKGIYNSEIQKEIFSDFTDSLINKLFKSECEKHISKIDISDDVAADAIDMTAVGSNTLY